MAGTPVAADISPVTATTSAAASTAPNPPTTAKPSTTAKPPAEPSPTKSPPAPDPATAWAEVDFVAAATETLKCLPKLGRATLTQEVQYVNLDGDNRAEAVATAV